MEEALHLMPELGHIMKVLLADKPALAARLVPMFDSFPATARHCSAQEMTVIGQEVCVCL